MSDSSESDELLTLRMTPLRARKRIAIVGARYTGLAALWALKDTDHEVHIFDSRNNFEGFTHRLLLRTGDENKLAQVDVGLGIFQPSVSRQSPQCPIFLRCISSLVIANLCAFLKELQLPNATKEFSFSWSSAVKTFTWYYGGILGILWQFRGLLRLRTWGLFLEIIRFNYSALDALHTLPSAREGEHRRDDGSNHNQPEPKPPVSIGTYLETGYYSENFRDRYIIPLVMLLWEVGDGTDALELPVETLFRFMWSCDMLKFFTRWRPWTAITVDPVDFNTAMKSILPSDRIHLRSQITSVRPGLTPGKVQLRFNGRGMHQRSQFDHVIMAVPANEVLDMTSGHALNEEVEILGKFGKPNPATVAVHSDTTVGLGSYFII